MNDLYTHMHSDAMNPSTSLKTILDLEDISLQHIVSLLPPDDRKNLALACKSLCAIVRSQWKTLLVDLSATDEDDGPVPPGIAQFCSLRTVIWADNVANPKDALDEIEWDTNPDLEPPESREITPIKPRTIDRLRRVNQYIYIAKQLPTITRYDELQPPHKYDTIAKEHEEEIRRRMLPTVHDVKNSIADSMVLDEGHASGVDDRLLELFGDLQAGDGGGGAGGYGGEVFAPAPPTSSDDDDDLASVSDESLDEFEHVVDDEEDNHDHMDIEIEELEEDEEDDEEEEEELEEQDNHPSSSTQRNQNQSDNRSSQTKITGHQKPSLIIAAPLMLTGDKLKSLLFYSRPHWYQATKALSDMKFPDLVQHMSSLAYPLPLPYNLNATIDVGWVDSDGTIPYYATRATVVWCAHDDRLIRPKCKGDWKHIEGLRVCVKTCDADIDETSIGFANTVLPCLTNNALPRLRELHLGRPLNFGQHLDVDPARLDLPLLTKLVFNEMVVFGRFEQLTHLTALKSLAIALPAAGFESQPQDLSSLSSLRHLRSLRLEFWQVEDHQDVASLQHLTELELENMEGRVHLTKPSRPMPNLAGVTLTRMPHHQDMRFIEDSKFARWSIRHAAQLFPSVEVLHLGTLGSAPAEVKSTAELHAAAAVVDSHLRQLLTIAGAHSLQYLQVDTVLNITDDALDKRCETGSVQVVDHVHVAIGTVAGSVAGTAAAANTAATGVFGNGGGGAPGEEEDDEEEEGLVEAQGGDPVGGGGPEIVWERSVEFVTCESTDVLVAEFHYRRLTTAMTMMTTTTTT